MTRRPRRRPLLWALGAAGAVLGLRAAGLLAGPVAVAGVVALVAWFPARSPFSVRALVAAAFVLGWIPVLGWMPGLARTVDLPGLLLAGWTAVLAARAATGSVGPPRRPRLTTSEGLALAAGGLVSAFWAWPLLHTTTAGRLALLGRGYDHAAHFEMFSANLARGNFMALDGAASTGGNLAWFDYPQGLHYVWALAVRLWSPKASADAFGLLDTYAWLVVATAGVVTAIAGLAVARLAARGAAGALTTGPVMAALAAVMTVGPLSITVSEGYGNFALAAVAAGVAVSLLLRPSLAPRAQSLVVIGFALVAVSTWFPMAAGAAPAAVTTLVPVWRLGRRAFAAIAAVGLPALVGAAVTVVLPTVAGPQVLLRTGGIPPVPPLLFLAATVGVVLLIRRRWRALPWGPRMGLVGPPAFGIAAVTAVVAYEVRSVGHVTYYGDKLATGVTVSCLVVAAALATEWLRDVRVGRRRLLLGVGAALAGLLVVLRLDPAFDTRLAKYASPSAAERTAATELLATATETQATSAPGTDWIYVDTDGVGPSPVLSDIWFGILVGEASLDRLARSNTLGVLAGRPVASPEQARDVLGAALGPEAVGRLRFAVN